ncbi:hypothetical protein A3Q56_06447 [Intoshia linei]|uniref:Uncharacterized protein n=1 Tax=Intoshia linei TaxID=1819745 RepID=A0A177AWR1_9BILA|nr:hypothetical protein A3Q56_06447 [Intoshia linei]
MEFHLNANRNNLIYSNSSISTLKKTDSVCSDDQNYTNLHNGRQIIIDCYASQIKEIRNSIPQDSDLFDKEIKYCNAQICKHCAYQLDENWTNDYASSENEILSSLLKLVNFEDDEIQKICQFYHFNELFTMSKKEIYIVLNHFISEINLLSLETLDNIFKLIKVTLNQIKHVTDYTYMVPTYSCTNESLNKKFVMRINTSCTMTVKDKFRMMKRYSSVFDCDEIESKDNTNTEHLSAGSTPVSTEKHFFSPATETKKIDHNIHNFYYHINCSRLCAKTCSISEKPKTKISSKKYLKKSSVKSKRNSSYFKTSRSSTSGFYNSSSTKGNTYSRNSDISESTQISTTRSLNNDALKSVYKTASCMDDFSINNRFSSNEIDHLVVHENALDLLIEKYYIPMNELNEISLVEDGDFGCIYRAQWHGAINIRISKLDVLDEINLEKTYCQMV